jgi:hypothetical protein
VIDARAFDSAQLVYNMLNPSAATALPANYPAQISLRSTSFAERNKIGRPIEGGLNTVAACN